MQLTAKQIAALIEGRIEGNPEALISRVSKIEEGVPESLSFLSNPKYESHLYQTEASVVIINEDLDLQKAVSATLIRVKDAYSALSKLLDLYQTMRLDYKARETHYFVYDSASVG